MPALQCAIKAITWDVHEDRALTVTSSSEVDRKIDRKKGPDWNPFFLFWRWSQSCAEDALRQFSCVLSPYFTGASRQTSLSIRKALTSDGKPKRSRSPPKVMIDGRNPRRPPEITTASKSYLIPSGEPAFQGGDAGGINSVHVAPSLLAQISIGLAATGGTPGTSP